MIFSAINLHLVRQFSSHLFFHLIWAFPFKVKLWPDLTNLIIHLIYLSQLIIFQLEKTSLPMIILPRSRPVAPRCFAIAPVWPVQAQQRGPRNADASWVSGSRSSSPGEVRRKNTRDVLISAAKIGISSCRMGGWRATTYLIELKRHAEEITLSGQKLYIVWAANKWTDCILSCEK